MVKNKCSLTSQAASLVKGESFLSFPNFKKIIVYEAGY